MNEMTTIKEAVYSAYTLVMNQHTEADAEMLVNYLIETKPKTLSTFFVPAMLRRVVEVVFSDAAVRDAVLDISILMQQMVSTDVLDAAVTAICRSYNLSNGDDPELSIMPREVFMNFTLPDVRISVAVRQVLENNYWLLAYYLLITQEVK
jgi:hypothetical protein